MNNFNLVVMSGVVDIEPKNTKIPNTAITKCMFTLRHETTKKGFQGSPDKTEGCDIEVILWGPKADQFGPLLSRGVGVFVKGRIKVAVYQGKSSFSIVADEIVITAPGSFDYEVPAPQARPVQRGNVSPVPHQQPPLRAQVQQAVAPQEQEIQFDELPF